MMTTTTVCFMNECLYYATEPLIVVWIVEHMNTRELHFARALSKFNSLKLTLPIDSSNYRFGVECSVQTDYPMNHE